MKKISRRNFLAASAAAVAALGLSACGDNNTPAGSNPTGGNQGGGDGASAVLNESNIGLLSKTYANSATKKHDTFVLGSTADPGSLAPYDINNPGKEMLEEIFERLYCIDGFGGELLPQLAESAPEFVDGGYDIKIREGIVDSEGNDIKAADVVYSYAVLIENSVPQNMTEVIVEGPQLSKAGSTGNTVSATAKSEYVVHFETGGELVGVSDMGNLFAQQLIFSQASYEKSAAAAADGLGFVVDPIGSGPYVLDKYVEGSETILKVNDSYWAEGKDFQLARYCANVEQLTFRVSSQDQQYNGLATGALDYSNTVPTLDMEHFLEGGDCAEDFSVYSYLSNLTYYAFPNCDEVACTSDINIRKAILYACDGNAIKLLSGNENAEVVYDLFNSKFPEYRDSWFTEDNFYTNPSAETAKQYLADSTYEELGRPTIRVMCMTDDVQVNAAEAVVSMLKDVGFNAEIKASSTEATDEEDPSNWEVVIGMMAADDYGVVDIKRLLYKGGFTAPREAKNFAVDSEMQELIELVNTAAGHTEENTQKLHELIIDKAYGRGLFAESSNLVVRNCVTELSTNFKYNPLPGGHIFTDNEF